MEKALASSRLSLSPDRFAEMRAKGDYYVTVIEDLRSNKIIGSAIRAHLEDVVVDDTYRGKQLGKLIVVTVTLLAEVIGCYKMSLECKDKLIPFYRSIGYVDEKGNSNSMTLRYANQTHL
jgi:glucosamine-phosphate N-acetyltransferase